MVVITWLEYAQPINRMFFSSLRESFRNKMQNNGSCTNTSKKMKLFNHNGCSSMRKSSFVLIWNSSNRFANDGMNLPGTIAWESIKIVAGMCVAKYAINIRLKRLFIFLLLLVMIFFFSWDTTFLLRGSRLKRVCSDAWMNVCFCVFVFVFVCVYIYTFNYSRRRWVTRARFCVCLGKN